MNSVLRKTAKSESWLDTVGRYWGTYVPLLLNHPANHGRTGPNQYFEVLEAGLNQDDWAEAAYRVSNAPGGAIDYFSHPDNAEDAELLYRALSNRVAVREAENARTLAKHRYKISETKKWLQNNPGKEMSDAELSEIMAKYDAANPKTDLKLIHKQLGAVIDHANKTPGDFANNFSTTMRVFRDAQQAGNYLFPRDPKTGKIIGRNSLEEYFNEDGKKHIDAVNRLASDPARMNILKRIDTDTYNDINKYKKQLSFASRNHGALKSLYSLYNNPFMWLVRAIFLGDRDALSAIRGMHAMTTDRNSEWYQVADDTLGAVGLGPEDRKNIHTSIKKAAKPYMPWARLLHNVRGVAGGDKDFKPIIYRGR